MSKRQQHLSEAQRAAKKAAVLGTDKKSRFPYLLAICVALAAGVGIWYVTTGGTTASSVTAQPSAVSQTPAETPASAEKNAAPQPADQVTYATTLFTGGQAQFFEYQDGGITIKYFIVKGSDGMIRAAFDACDVCWREGKGYRQEGGDMICNNCGRHFKISMIGQVQGGCNPSPLNNRIENNNVIIALKDILAGKSYFDLAKGRN